MTFTLQFRNPRNSWCAFLRDDYLKVMSCEDEHKKGGREKRVPQRGSQIKFDRRWNEVKKETKKKEWRTLRKSQGGRFWRKSSSSHQAPICSGTNHCSDGPAQRGKHFSSPHREAMESRFIFPDGLSSSGSSRPSWSCFLWPAYSFCPTLTI